MSNEPRSERPKPEYGEYAPEGWVSPVPKTETPTSEGSASEETTPRVDAPRSTPTPTTSAPHNLGLGGSSSHNIPEQAQQPPQQAPQQPLQQPTEQQQPNAKRGSTGDRVATLLLLLFGAFAAMNFAFSFLTLGSQLEIMASIMGADDLVIPGSIAVLEAAGVITMLSIYAVALIWSVQRLRQKRIAFWVPLAAGVLAVIMTLIFAAISVALVPELLTYATPENVEILFNELSSQR